MKLDETSRSDTGKRVSNRKVAGAVVVLLAAMVVWMVVREFRFRSSGEKDVAEAPKVVQPVGWPVGWPVVLDVQEEVPAEEAIIEPETIEPEPVRPATSIAEADEQSDAVVEAEMAAEPVDEDPKSKAKRARAALALIGYDPEADAVYIQLINDPSVTANDRHNLIEDLNEDGFPDPDNPTVDDLPMIEYRIDLIDDHAPYAMDKTNADAFKEARKDLVNMVNRLTR
jgi:hypothetical protein